MWTTVGWSAFSASPRAWLVIFATRASFVRSTAESGTGLPGGVYGIVARFASSCAREGRGPVIASSFTDTGPPPQNDSACGCDPTGDLKSGFDEPDNVSIPPGPGDVNRLTLRPYQREAVEAIIAGFKQFKRQLRVCPTGGGKTIEFAALAGHYQPGKTLIIAHRDELIEQARDKVYRFTGLCPDIEKAEACASLGAPIVVASIQTLCRRNPFPPGHFALVVVDEAHHVLSESFQRVLAS